MASIAPQTSFQPPPSSRPDPSPNKLLFSTCRLSSASSGLRLAPASFLSHSLSRHYDHASCRCSSNGVAGGGGSIADDSSGDERWDRAVQDVFRGAIRKLEDLRESFLNWNMDRSVGPEEGYGGDMDEWDWERWKKHFCDVDDQEKIVSVLKSQLATAVNSENYKDAAKLKVAIAAAATNDTIGKVMSHLNRALQEEKYDDAALLRDYAGAGLVGWWAGISENTRDPHGCIIHISAEHGRYVARSYSPRQLVSALDGSPMFEIFFTKTNKGEFKQQAVYLKRPKTSPDFPNPLKSSKLLKKFDPLNPTEDNRSLLDENTEDPDNDESDEESSFENTLRDIIPGVKVKVLNVITPNKLDKDFISKVVDQIIDGEDEEEDVEVENADSGDEVTSESDEDQENIILDADNELRFGEEQSQIAVKVVVGGLLSKSSGTAKKDLLRVPAKLEKKDRLSFTFTVEEDDDTKSGENGKAPPSKKAKLQDQLNVDSVMLDIAKFIGKGRIPRKVLKDVGELINFTLSQAQNRQPLSGSTRFSRIDIPGNQDPLNGLYVGAHGLHASEVIHLRRRVGQWKEDGHKKDPLNLEFYEYVEAVKVTGDPYVPAGQIAFRAKVGQRYQLPHKGIIPEEFGVIARYKGQGRLAEPGFRNPRWVDGELVVLDGKYIKGGPVVGFVYWAPEFHFLVFFNRLRLHE